MHSNHDEPDMERLLMRGSFLTLSATDSLSALTDKVKKYKNGDRLYFTRFGDADFIMMYPESVGQTIGHNNRFVVTEEFQKELIDSFNIEDDSYMTASCLNLQGKHSTHQNIISERVAGLMRNKTLAYRPRFYSATTGFENFIETPESFLEFCKIIHDKKKTWVCQHYHDNIEKIYGNIKHHISTPAINSYSSIDEWWPKLLDSLDDVDVIMCATGQSSRVICGRLWNMGVTKIVLDFGHTADLLVADTEIKDKIRLRGTFNHHGPRILESLKFMLDNFEEQ